MNILVLAPYYWPDGGAASNQFTLLSEAIVELGHQVTVIAGVPHYPSGRVPEEYRSFRVQRDHHHGVNIVRVPLPSINRSRMFLRLVQFVAYQLGSALVGRTLTYDLLLMYGPSLEIWLPFFVLGVRRKVPIVYSVHDVYPEVGVRLGVFRNRFVISLVSRLENYCLQHANKIRILSKSFKESLMARGVAAEKMSLIYDWVATGVIKPMPRANPFTRQHDLEGKFVVLFTGNLGYVQGLESIVEAASRLKYKPDIQFVFVGHGAARKSLMEMVADMNLDNVRFIGWQPAEKMPEIYASADISLVSLRKGMAFDALPSKTFAIMASGRPLVASLDPGSDAWDLIERTQSGIPVPAGEPDALVDAIMWLKQDPSKSEQFALNGREYVLSHHSPRSAAESFEKLCLQALREQLSDSVIEMH